MIRYAVLAVVAAAALAGCSSAASPAPTATPAAKLSQSPTPSPSPTALPMAQVASLVRTLYYNESQAYQSSLKQGDALALADDYPGSEDKTKYLACAATFEAQNPGETISEVPEIGTLAPDPNWIGPPQGKGQADWIFAGKKPNGQTYILTLDSTFTYASGQQQTSKDQVHVTIWNGKAYDYQFACPG